MQVDASIDRSIAKRIHGIKKEFKDTGASSKGLQETPILYIQNILLSMMSPSLVIDIPLTCSVYGWYVF